MLIVGTPICPRCGDCVMTRELSWLDVAGIVITVFVFFPLAIWLYLSPRRLYCQNCGKVLSDSPPEA